WSFGDGKSVRGREVAHTWSKPGIYEVELTVAGKGHTNSEMAIVRVHTAETLRVPQVVLDTDAKNEQDDQHYLGYALHGEFDLLAVNSIHHGGGQEPVNYGEIRNVFDLARRGGLPSHRFPRIYRGANARLDVPSSGRWEDTEPRVTAASNAILAAARGASPGNPAWVVPVGPGTNTASAILQARREGLDLRDRLRIMWLGGSNDGILREFNGRNDPWSMFVVGRSGLDVWIMPAPVGATVRIDKRREPDLYAATPLGEYLKRITPARNKPLFDPACLAAVIDLRLDLGWIERTETVIVNGPEKGYRWEAGTGPGTVKLIRRIRHAEVKRDIFDTMKDRPTKLKGRP
ncbi:MAG: PKD domain-containing protein, partial [Planctomycetota bacterium]